MRGILVSHRTACGDAFVDHICVRKDRRRGGIGSALLYSLPPPISLITCPLTKAMTFYMNHGFESTTSPPYAPKSGEMALRATHLPQTEHAFTIRHTAWSEMTLADRSDMIELVRGNPCDSSSYRLSQGAALRLLCVEDPNVQYAVVD